MNVSYRLGIDENGLGALLGPMVVTAVCAEVDEQGRQLLARRLPKRLRQDLDDSKRLVSHSDVALGEAWARALCGSRASTPDQLFHDLCFESPELLQKPCPKHVSAQCWSPSSPEFCAPQEDVERLLRHLRFLQQRGVVITHARSSILCNRILNEQRRAGGNRFTSDLHAMERLTLNERERVGSDVIAVCGKVGGISDYSKFFGPLAGWLHAVLDHSRARSAYKFPGVGELHFIRDADASDPLVMLASLIGKYLRELLMSKVASYYDPERAGPSPSGYHDPITRHFIKRTEHLRRKRRIPKTCFTREGVNG